MARIYGSRQLLDPSMIQYFANRADRNVQFNNELSNRNADSIRSLLENAGKTAGEYRQEQERRNAVSEWDVGTDPLSRAALIDWYQKGNTAGLGQVQSLANAKLQNEAAAKMHQDIRDQEEQARKDRIANQVNDSLQIQLASIEDIYRKNNNTNDVPTEKVAGVLNGIRELERLGYNKALVDRIKDRIKPFVPQEQPTPQTNEQVVGNEPVVNNVEQQAQVTNRFSNMSSENILKTLLDDKVSLENEIKGVNRRDKNAVDSINEKIAKLNSEVKEQGLANEVKFIEPVKQITIPTLKEFNEGYANGKFTAAQGRKWGYKMNPDTGDWISK